MHYLRRRAALLSILAGAGLAGLASAAASCASPGQGTNESFDAGAADGTTGADSGAGPGDSSAGSTCDANTQTDWNNCGACGHRCATNDTCSCGQCTAPCGAGQSACCGKCIDTASDPYNCGQCGNECFPPSGGNVTGVAKCENSRCTFTCPVPEGGAEAGTIVACGADAGPAGCYDLTSAQLACGACGHACGTGLQCMGSLCCTAGSGVCGGACSNLQSDPANCGACDAGCPSPGQCTGGKCLGYVTSNPPDAFLDACAVGGTTVGALGGSSGWLTSTAISIPFTFSFYGTAQSQIFLGSEVTLGLGGTPNGIGYPDCKNPILFTNYPAIMAFADGNVSTGKVCYATVGSAPNRKLVASWDNLTYAGDASFALDVSIVLSEGSSAIELQYAVPGAPGDGGADAGSVAVTDSNLAGANATIGLQVDTFKGPNLSLSCDTSFVTSLPLSVALTPL